MTPESAWIDHFKDNPHADKQSFISGFLTALELEEGYALAMLVLQSKVYYENPEIRNAVDNYLSTIKPNLKE